MNKESQVWYDPAFNGMSKWNKVKDIVSTIWKRTPTVGKLVGTSIVAATAGAFIDELMESIKERKATLKSKEYFEKMIEAHPELAKKDPKIVAQYWESLYHFAPYMAQDPLAAGSFIRQSIDRGYPELYGGPPIDVYNTLAAMTKAVEESKSGKKRFGKEVTLKALGDVYSAGYLRTMGWNK